MKIVKILRTAIYPGSFDPITNGHVDIIERAAKLFDRLIVAVAVNEAKHPLFTLEEREQQMREACGHLTNVRVTRFEGLLVSFAQAEEASVVVRGLRAVSDFEFEFQLAQMNKNLAPAVETLFMMTSTDWSYLSSRIVREIAGLGGAVSDLVPANVERALARKFSASGETFA